MSESRAAYMREYRAKRASIRAEGGLLPFQSAFVASICRKDNPVSIAGTRTRSAFQAVAPRRKEVAAMLPAPPAQSPKREKARHLKRSGSPGMPHFEAPPKQPGGRGPSVTGRSPPAPYPSMGQLPAFQHKGC